MDDSSHIHPDIKITPQPKGKRYQLPRGVAYVKLRPWGHGLFLLSIAELIAIGVAVSTGHLRISNVFLILLGFGLAGVYLGHAMMMRFHLRRSPPEVFIRLTRKDLRIQYQNYWWRETERIPLKDLNKLRVLDLDAEDIPDWISHVAVDETEQAPAVLLFEQWKSEPTILNELYSRDLLEALALDLTASSNELCARHNPSGNTHPISLVEHTPTTNDYLYSDQPPDSTATVLRDANCGGLTILLPTPRPRWLRRTMIAFLLLFLVTGYVTIVVVIYNFSSSKLGPLGIAVVCLILVAAWFAWRSTTAPFEEKIEISTDRLVIHAKTFIWLKRYEWTPDEIAAVTVKDGDFGDACLLTVDAPGLFRRKHFFGYRRKAEITWLMALLHHELGLDDRT